MRPNKTTSAPSAPLAICAPGSNFGVFSRKKGPSRLALVAAAFEEVDAVPMEGFDPAAVDAILDLGAKNLRSVILLPLGYRANEGDWLVDLKKVRRERANFVTEIK